eukprot:TRINITY_DN1947_c0_g1_i1.p1 TRINITY_DN1947_c0_g1~~TRINITY_DN1947_c0_g1_i1.p1  ORF type:complete len:391 (+),score=110.92 TRINITY_DN1947_c0_g1_i1:89-1174(+)
MAMPDAGTNAATLTGAPTGLPSDMLGLHGGDGVPWELKYGDEIKRLSPDQANAVRKLMNGELPPHSINIFKNWVRRVEGGLKFGTEVPPPPVPPPVALPGMHAPPPAEGKGFGHCKGAKEGNGKAGGGKAGGGKAGGGKAGGGKAGGGKGTAKGGKKSSASGHSQGAAGRLTLIPQSAGGSWVVSLSNIPFSVCRKEVLKLVYEAGFEVQKKFLKLEEDDQGRWVGAHLLVDEEDDALRMVGVLNGQRLHGRHINANYKSLDEHVPQSSRATSVNCESQTDEPRTFHVECQTRELPARTGGQRDIDFSRIAQQARDAQLAASHIGETLANIASQCGDVAAVDDATGLAVWEDELTDQFEGE